MSRQISRQFILRVYPAMIDLVVTGLQFASDRFRNDSAAHYYEIDLMFRENQGSTRESFKDQFILLINEYGRNDWENTKLVEFINKVNGRAGYPTYTDEWVQTDRTERP